MPGIRRVHRFRDHAVAGVNWRPTRFVDEVPSWRVCGLCRMIPKRTVLLPCEHVLCQSCHAANSQGCGGRCPLDQEPFEEAECVSHDMPAKRANALKVYCWNEVHGCQFEGTVESMPGHYENECTFHTVECLRCGEEVLHRELSMHYVARCSAAVSTAGIENTSSESAALSLQDVTAALKEPKTLLRDANNEQRLLAIQGQMNELTEQVSNQESRTAVITQDAAASATSEVAQVAAPSPATSLQEGTSRQNPTEQASTSSTSPKSKRPKVEPLVNLPTDVLQAMRKTSSQDYPQHFITCLLSGVECHLELKRPLSTTDAWREVLGSVTYVLTVEKFPRPRPGKKFAVIRVLHTRDAYIEIEIGEHSYDFFVRVNFYGKGTPGNLCPPPVFVVKACHIEHAKFFEAGRSEEPCRCQYDGELLIHCHHVFNVNHLIMLQHMIQKVGYKLKIEIELSQA